MTKKTAVITNWLILLLILGFAAFIWWQSRTPEKATAVELSGNLPRGGNPLYEEVGSFNADKVVQAFCVGDSLIYAAMERTLVIYTHTGAPVKEIRLEEPVSALRLYDDTLYVLHPGGLARYTTSLQAIERWDPCSENAYYCDLAIGRNRVYISDAENKLIATYTRSGDFDGFIQHPDRFTIPGTEFPLSELNDTLYVGHSGTHKVERYTGKDQFINAFGRTGTAEGSFPGCCNPCGLDIDQQQRILTAEKGLARVSRYTREGKYDALLISNLMLGKSHIAPLLAYKTPLLYLAHARKIAWYKEKSESHGK